MRTTCAAIALTVYLVGCGRPAPPTSLAPAGTPADPRIPADGGLEAVRAYLRENLDAGEWEEVRFWAARPAVKHHQAAIREWETLPLELPGDERVAEQSRAEAEKLKKGKPRVAARMKYRAAVPGGGTELTDQVFVIEDGRAVPIDRDRQRHYLGDLPD